MSFPAYILTPSELTANLTSIRKCSVVEFLYDVFLVSFWKSHNLITKYFLMTFVSSWFQGWFRSVFARCRNWCTRSSFDSRCFFSLPTIRIHRNRMPVTLAVILSKTFAGIRIPFLYSSFLSIHINHIFCSVTMKSFRIKVREYWKHCIS